MVSNIGTQIITSFFHINNWLVYIEKDNSLSHSDKENIPPSEDKDSDFNFENYSFKYDDKYFTDSK